MAAPGPATTSLVLLLLVVLLVARRVARMVRGTPLRPGRLLGYTVLFLLLFAFVVLDEAFYLPLYVPLTDVAVVVLVALLAVPYVTRRAEVYRADGAWHYRLGYVIPAVYLTLFVVRMAMDLVVLGIDPFGAPPGGLTLSGAEIAALAVVDALFAVSTGLLVGRSVGIYRAYERARASVAPAPAPPLS